MLAMVFPYISILMYVDIRPCLYMANFVPPYMFIRASPGHLPTDYRNYHYFSTGFSRQLASKR